MKIDVTANVIVIDDQRAGLRRTAAAQSQIARHGTRATDRSRASVVDLSALT